MQRFKTHIAPVFEITVWITGLLLLACMAPGSGTHFSLCLFKWLGVDFCPGCGLGHSISWFFHGEVERSFRSHPLGIFAVAILLSRIYTLSKKQFTITKN